MTTTRQLRETTLGKELIYLEERRCGRNDAQTLMCCANSEHLGGKCLDDLLTEVGVDSTVEDTSRADARTYMFFTPSAGQFKVR